MRRAVGIVLVHALVAAWTVAPSLHEHDYVGHDHPEHHHGPASHSHEDPSATDHADSFDRSDDSPAIQADACGPGQHLSAITAAYTQAGLVQIDLAEPLGPSVALAVTSIRSAWPVTDIRVHGPPVHRRPPPRAPPLNYLA